MQLGAGESKPDGEGVWRDSFLLLRRDCVRPKYRDAFSHRVIEPVERSGKHLLPLADLFSHLPVALLESVD
jgi:maltooligosyltrehalose synthase